MVSGKTRVFVLLGSPVEHSMSPSMQNAAFHALGIDAAYVPLRCDPGDVPFLIRVFAGAGGGGNITVPHKETAAKGLTFSTSRVKETDACNTFWGEAGVVRGDNTDIAGVLAALDRLEAPATRWLLIGTGGSARAVCAAARQRGAAIAVQSRSLERKRGFESWAVEKGVKLTELEECEVVINATPLGMGANDPFPISPEAVPLAVAALDLVYAPDGTRWAHAMGREGKRAADGREAVIAQGAAAFECWFPDQRAPTEVMRAVVNATLC